MTKIAHASNGENGITGGKAGDQTGAEVCVRDWYNKPWNCVIRFNDPNTAEKVAYFMEKACANDYIGYDQWERNTLHSELKKVGFDVTKVSKPCETDCSALVSDACIYAGVKESVLFVGGNLSVTSNLRARLLTTNLVTVYTTDDYTKGTTKLKRGDILLNDAKHVAVVVSGSVATVPTPAPVQTVSNVSLHMLKKGAKGREVLSLQILLNKKFGADLLEDGDFGPLTANAVAVFQKNHNDAKGNKLEVDSIVGSKTWESIILF